MNDGPSFQSLKKSLYIPQKTSLHILRVALKAAALSVHLLSIISPPCKRTSLSKVLLGSRHNFRMILRGSYDYILPGEHVL